MHQCIPSAISSLATKKFVVVCRLPPNFKLPRFPRVFNRSPVPLAGFVPPQILAAHGEHSSVEITNKYYVTQTVAQRAEHTALIAKGFSGGV